MSLDLACILAVAVLAACARRCWLDARGPRVWTVWAGYRAEGGHGTSIACRKTRGEALAMLERDPAGRVAVDARYWPGVVPPRDGVPRDTVMWGQPIGAPAG